MLDPQVSATFADMVRLNDRGTRHYGNLSRGLTAVQHLPFGTYVAAVRIPSTWCEQHLWGRVLETLGAHFYFDLAMGREVLVHDRSEKRRETRAMWQGLSWIRYAVNRAWGLPNGLEFTRNGMFVGDYWEEEWRKLPKRTIALLRYYKDYVTDPNSSVRLYPCGECKERAVMGA